MAVIKRIKSALLSLFARFGAPEQPTKETIGQYAISHHREHAARKMPPKTAGHIKGPPPYRSGRWPIKARSTSKYRPSGGFLLPEDSDGRRH
ncbi:hypothetical protein ACKC9G_18495 [Pokkaliibacter sp. CJK22405]|uniref:hypothetical protein n=1 Tax=Pokkaliibacter sp. CJK22405 TaxID=3384615 RepID=UPI003984FE8C